MMAIYVDCGFPASPGVLDFLTSFQPDKKSLIQEKGEFFCTRINGRIYRDFCVISFHHDAEETLAVRSGFASRGGGAIR